MRSDSKSVEGIFKYHEGSAFRLMAFCVLLTVCLVSCVSCKKSSDVEGGGAKLKTEVEQNVTGLIASEDLILDLTPQLKRIALWVEQRTVGAEANPPELGEMVAVRGLSATDAEKLFTRNEKYPDFLEKAEWPIEQEVSLDVAYPWKPLDVLGIKWETMKFGVLSGSFESENLFTIHSKVEGRGRSSGSVWGMKGHQDFQFEQKAGSWELTKWLQGDLFLERAAQPLFREV
ncbi:MAG: hypothetical protein GY748_20235, partial [Planctomycetaceae bacterium]|nr:hypothetical protein [Planctomycetaceae bacterium]